MKKILILITSLILAMVMLTACHKSDAINVSVEFMVGRERYDARTEEQVAAMGMPVDPVKYNHTFDGWYFDEKTWERPFNEHSFKELASGSEKIVKVYAKFTKNHITYPDVPQEPVGFEEALELFKQHNYYISIKFLSEDYTIEQYESEDEIVVKVQSPDIGIYIDKANDIEYVIYDQEIEPIHGTIAGYEEIMEYIRLVDMGISGDGINQKITLDAIEYDSVVQVEYDCVTFELPNGNEVSFVNNDNTLYAMVIKDGDEEYIGFNPIVYRRIPSQSSLLYGKDFVMVEGCIKAIMNDDTMSPTIEEGQICFFKRIENTSAIRGNDIILYQDAGNTMSIGRFVNRITGPDSNEQCYVKADYSYATSKIYMDRIIGVFWFSVPIKDAETGEGE